MRLVAGVVHDDRTADPADPGSRGGDLVLDRDFAVAAWWSLLGTALVAAGVFFVVDTAGHPVAWVGIGVSVVVAAYFVLQLVAPAVTRLHLRHDELRGRRFLRTVDIPWREVQLARVRRRFGDPVLVLDVREQTDTTRINLVLPVGCDLAALHGFLEGRLGRADQRPDSREYEDADA